MTVECRNACVEPVPAESQAVEIIGRTWTMNRNSGEFVWPELPDPSSDTASTDIQGELYMGVIQTLDDLPNPSEGAPESPIELMRATLTPYLQERHPATLAEDTVLAVSELVNNALRPRTPADPNKFDEGWCQIWIGRSAGSKVATHIAILTQVSDVSVCEETREGLQPMTTEQLMASIGEESERGRGMFISAAVFAENNIEATVTHLPVEHTPKDFMLIQLAVPRYGLAA